MYFNLSAIVLSLLDLWSQCQVLGYGSHKVTFSSAIPGLGVADEAPIVKQGWGRWSWLVVDVGRKSCKMPIPAKYNLKETVEN